ncbi:NAD(P)-binding domain-containing protein, partial [Lachnospiraceae bacterium OttesenSCG-928-E19]|nr:NAD(P)-binding domain-containing protein [Lachnospiraceae bacterium OttesenSCG-928-E19]
ELCDTYGIHYLGVGVSGGEKGALYGPSMMAGGSEEGYQICQNILETCAASVDKVPCCAYVGPQGAGHYVKMVHNGMEYAMLQIVAEIYTFMKQSLRLSHEKILETFEGWKRSGISSYIIDISVSVLRKNENGKPLVEQILDVAGQKGTGRWTLEEGIQRGIYIPTIYEAVAARNFSLRKEERKKGNQILGTLQEKMEIEFYQKVMGDALELGMLICYAQGFSLIEQASTDFEWNMELANLAVIWRKGCIIRSEMLSSIQKALQEESMIIFSSQFKQIEELSKALRLCVGKANQAGMAMPGLASVMHYYDYYRMETLPIQFIQALRDCFGAHTYQRIDKEGDFHTNWEE